MMKAAHNSQPAFLNFTQHLRETLAESRTHVEDWCVQERQHVDAKFDEAKQELDHAQIQMDRACTKLITLQLESGLKLLENTNEDETNNHPEGNNDSDKDKNNVGAKRRHLQRQVDEQKNINESLDRELQLTQKELEGTVTTTYFRILDDVGSRLYNLDIHHYR